MGEIPIAAFLYGNEKFILRGEEYMKVKVTNSCKGNWYHVGEVYEVRDIDKYSSIGVQVYNSDDEQKHPDIIMNGDFEYIN